MQQVKAGVIGGTGYTGVELLRLLVVHPNVELCAITSRSDKGKAVSDLYPSLRGYTDVVFCEPSIEQFKGCDVVFAATPNGVAMQYARQLLEHGVKLIDLAADFRIDDVATWERWYQMTHACPELLKEAVYGLPELNAEQIKAANIIANPGCYPTASMLALLPLIDNKMIRLDDVVVDAKSGVTGAGRSASIGNIYSEITDSFKAYGVAGHRHHPEINQTLSCVAGEPVGLTFVPHLVPMLRGIHATVYANLVDKSVGVDRLLELYQDYYQSAQFVDILPAGQCPDTRSVRASNMCRIAVHKAVGSDKLVVLSVIDNLTKGAAGQAVQNMNLLFDLPEQSGLLNPALMP